MQEGSFDTTRGTEEGKTGLPRVLILEDDAGISKLMQVTLSGAATIVGNHARAEDVITPNEEGGHNVPKDFDILITDHGLAGDMTGIDATRILLEEYKRQGLRIPHIMMLTGSAAQVEKDALAVGVNEVIPKPFRPSAFVVKINDAYAKLQAAGDTQE